MDQVTQQNAALVEEGAAAAESLRQQAERLLSTASVFRVGDHEAAMRAMQAVLSKARSSAATSAKPGLGERPPATAVTARGEHASTAGRASGEWTAF